MNRRELLKIICAIGVSGVLPRFLCAAAPKRPTKLLFVHGRGQQGLNPETLKSEWLDALNEGAAKFGQKLPADVDVAFPFYGDALDKYTQQFGIPLTSDVHARGTATDDEFLVFQAQFAEAVRQR